MQGLVFFLIAIRKISISACLALRMIWVSGFACQLPFKSGSWLKRFTFGTSFMCFSSGTSSVVFGMFRLVRNKLKVGNIIIKPIMIDVMNNFGSQQFSTNVTFHYMPMFKNFFAVNIKNSVTVNYCAAFISIVIFAGHGNAATCDLAIPTAPAGWFKRLRTSFTISHLHSITLNNLSSQPGGAS